MGTNEIALNELINEAKKPDNEEMILKLSDRINSVDAAALRAVSADFDQLFDAWSEEITRSEDKAGLCVKLAELSILDTPNFRTALHFAVRKLLPPYLASNSVIKAIGAKDDTVSVRDAALRLRKLQHLRSTALVYQQENRQWGKINGIDKVTGTIAVNSIQTNSVSSMPIASAVITSLFFDTTPDFLNLLYPSKSGHASSAEYKEIFAKNALSEVSESKIHDIVANLMVPDIMSSEEFKAWWEKTPAKAGSAAGKRAFYDARSVLELHTILTTMAKEGEKPAVTEAVTEKLAKLFTNIRKEISAKDTAMLMDCVAYLTEPDTRGEALIAMFTCLRGKAPFWPAEALPNLPLAKLESWGHLSVKLLPSFVRATRMLYSEQEMAVIGTLLPLRCLGPVLDSISPAVVNETLLKLKNPSPDVILWIWKNRTHVSNLLKDSIDMAHVVSALSIENLPKEWTAAQRELKKQIFEKADFQKFVIENAGGDVPSIISAIQRSRSFQGGERQSIMVKLARHSEELKAYIEAGEGRRMMGGAAATPDQAPITSIRSHKRMIAELENLINVQIPENAAAVALARSFGDLRENAEYDAAKERRRFLHKRRSELEKTLGFIQGTDFKDVKVDGHAVLGTQVKLASASGAVREYYLLGAWDGDPEKNRISYKTRIGEAILNKKIGDTVEIPEAGQFTIKDVLPLPEELRKELADEI